MCTVNPACGGIGPADQNAAPPAIPAMAAAYYRRMPWWYAVVESKHDLQNPTSPEKIRQLGEHLGLGPGSHLLDVASGRGGPALLLAETFGCRVTCIEQAEEFASVARGRARGAGLEERIDVVQADARRLAFEPKRYDAAVCLGASFVWGGLRETVAALAPAVRARGFVAVGEPYWRRSPTPELEAELGKGFVTLPETVARFETAELGVVGVIASSEDDWDRYESLHWLALEEWLHEHPDDRDAAAFRARGAQYRGRYLRSQRDWLGWAIIVGRKR